MTTLIKKELVIKENKLPARYRLTDAGRRLALKLANGIDDDDDDDENETGSQQSSVNDNNLNSEGCSSSSIKVARYDFPPVTRTESVQSIGSTSSLSSSSSSLYSVPITISNSSQSSLIDDECTLIDDAPPSKATKTKSPTSALSKAHHHDDLIELSDEDNTDEIVDISDDVRPNAVVSRLNDKPTAVTNQLRSNPKQVVKFFIKYFEHVIF